MAENEWGYAGIEPTKEAMLTRLDGLMTYDRKPKAEAAELAKIFGQQ
ncbi:MAG: hypothetical protein ACRD68_07465 [Pyrinomonadaceae bacterium]